MKTISLALALSAALSLGGSARAQNANGLPSGIGVGAGAGAGVGAVGAADAGLNASVLSIGEGQAGLLNPGALAQADAVSVDVGTASLGAPGAAALQRWVRSGGVVFLHTDAAQLFGYTTVEARPGSPRQGGLLFGRARSALPYTSHPLLWNDGRAAPGEAAGASAAGVSRVYYRARPGDHLVVQHPAGVPLLRVLDLSAVNPQPLYAVAVAPYGRGWAVFTPFSLDRERADGALLARNLAAFARSSRVARGAPAVPGQASWVGVPANGLEAAVARVARGGVDAATIVALCDQALGRLAPADAAAVEEEARAEAGAEAEEDSPEPSDAVLIASRGEVAALRGLAAAEGPSPRVVAALCLMRARLALQRSNWDVADRWIEAAANRVPQSFEVAVWEGALLSARAEPVAQSSRDRAALWNECAGRWSAASRLPLLLGTAPSPSREALDSWARGAALAARLSSVEPPLFSMLGRGASAVTVRHYPNDPTLRLALPFGAWLAGSAARFGWRVEDEEILIFPSAPLFQAYRQASGLTETPFPNPLGRFGDIQGERILMVSQSTINVPLPVGPNGRVLFVPLGTAIPSVLARLHALLLVGALTEGGGPVPNWITLGLNGLAASSAVNAGANGNFGAPLFLNQFARLGLILGPRQFDELPPTGEQVSLAEVQAANMVAFLYARFGSGAVVEVLQRLGDGQSVDEAMDAATGLSEEEFFLAWRATIAPA